MNILRNQMIEGIKQKYGLNDPKVFYAMKQIPREEFVPHDKKDEAYFDRPIPIGWGQTISQPYTVAFMTHLLDLKETDRVLEIGTGSGYQSSVISVLAKEVYSIEIIPELAEQAKATLKKLKINNVYVKTGDGKEGWVEKSPFDKIIITAGLSNLPKILEGQLNEGGIILAPIGMGDNKLMTRFKKTEGRIVSKQFGEFHFVPFV